MRAILYGWCIVCVLTACSKNTVQSNKMSQEEQVLATSSFYPGEWAASVRPQITSGETGSISGPSQPPQGSDQGTLPAPGTGGQTTPPSGGATTPPPVVAPPATDPGASNPAPSTPPSDPSAPGTPTVPSTPSIPGPIAGNGEPGTVPPPGTPGSGSGEPGTIPGPGTTPPGTTPPGTTPPGTTPPGTTPPGTTPPGTTPPGTTPPGTTPPGTTPPGEPGTIPGEECKCEPEKSYGRNHRHGRGCSHRKPKCVCKPKSVGLSVRPVCSFRRSGSAAEFFEEAHNPIVTFEAAVYLPRRDDNRTRQLASAGFVKYPASTLSQGSPIHYLIRQVSLKSVDLFQGRYNTKVNIDTAAFKAAYPREWRDALVDVRVCDDSNKDGFCSDERANQMLSVRALPFSVSHLPSTVAVEVFNGRHRTLASDPEFCEKQYSPLVLDLGGDGFALTGPESGVRFDLNDTGSPITTGWVVGTNDAFLVRDLNGNGRIDSGRELFGSATVLKNGMRAANGFLALADLDDDHDGWFTAKDSAWKSVRLWSDKTHDGVSNRGEIFRLEDFGIVGIQLKYTEISETDPYGNQTRQRSTFVRAENGTKKVQQIIDVWFNTLN